MSASSWLNVAAGVSAGAATTSGSPSVNCTNGGWCSQFNTSPAPLALTAGAVSWTNSALSVRASSAKGCSSAAVANGSLGGNASGGGLSYASAGAVVHNVALANAGPDWNGALGAGVSIAAALVLGILVGASIAGVCAATALVGCIVAGVVGGSVVGGIAGGTGALVSGGDTHAGMADGMRDGAIGGIAGGSNWGPFDKLLFGGNPCG